MFVKISGLSERDHADNSTHDGVALMTSWIDRDWINDQSICPDNGRLSEAVMHKMNVIRLTVADQTSVITPVTTGPHSNNGPYSHKTRWPAWPVRRHSVVLWHDVSD